MLKSLLQRIGAVVGFIFMLVITAVIGLMAWAFRQEYLEQQLYQRISTEGQRVTIQVDQASRDNKSWLDQFGNGVYIDFTYQHQPYTIRYKQDGGWINKGDTIGLFYHSGMHAFRQPHTHGSFKENKGRSRLLGFSYMNMWDEERKWLVLWLGMTALFALLLSGILATITRLQVLRTAGRYIFISMLLLGAVYCAYNTWQYYRYYNRLKSGSQEETMTVVSTSKHNVTRRTNFLYTYEASVLQGGREKEIPIEEEEYEKLRPGDRLQVLYNHSLDDMMSVNYTPEHINLFTTLFVWFLVFFFTRQQILKARKKAQATQVPPTR
jgi:hypothetical protein